MNKDKKRIKKFGLCNLIKKNNSMWYTKLLKAEYYNMENRMALNIIRLNKLILKT